MDLGVPKTDESTKNSTEIFCCNTYICLCYVYMRNQKQKEKPYFSFKSFCLSRPDVSSCSCSSFVDQCDAEKVLTRPFPYFMNNFVLSLYPSLLTSPLAFPTCLLLFVKCITRRATFHKPNRQGKNKAFI